MCALTYVAWENVTATYAANISGMKCLQHLEQRAVARHGASEIHALPRTPRNQIRKRKLMKNLHCPPQWPTDQNYA